MRRLALATLLGFVLSLGTHVQADQLNAKPDSKERNSLCDFGEVEQLKLHDYESIREKKKGNFLLDLEGLSKKNLTISDYRNHEDMKRLISELKKISGDYEYVFELLHHLGYSCKKRSNDNYLLKFYGVSIFPFPREEIVFEKIYYVRQIQINTKTDKVLMYTLPLVEAYP